MLSSVWDSVFRYSTGANARRGEGGESNREVTESKLTQEQQTFNQDIFLLVEHFNNQSKQLNIATEADSISPTQIRPV